MIATLRSAPSFFTRSRVLRVMCAWRSTVAAILSRAFRMTDITVNSTDRHLKRLHPLPLRIMHWLNALAMILMIGSGWKIYNDEVLFGWLHFPQWMIIGGGPEGALQWHFFAMWLLMVNGLIYLGYGLVTGRFRRKLLPI